MAVPSYRSKLIVLRGNSGSGKSTTAKALREASAHKIAIVEQDYLRRFVLKEKETRGGDNITLIEQVTEFALARDYHVILEGILHFARYGRMLTRLRARCPSTYFYYFAVSLEETLRRHTTKPNAHEFGETELRAWYQPNDRTGFPGEHVIAEASSLTETVSRILAEVGL
jgi:predicted kinase